MILSQHTSHCLLRLITVVILSSSVSAQLEPPQGLPIPPTGPPPAEIVGSSGTIVHFEALSVPRVTGQATFDPSSKKLIFRYAHAPIPGAAPLATGVDSYSLRYVPTCVARIDSNEFLVAGKKANRSTVIERWLFAAPTVDISGGTISAGARLARDVLFDDAVAGKSVVQAMSPILGTAGARKAFVLFHDSRVLYVLDVAANTLVPFATPHDPGGSGLLHLTDLDSGLWRHVAVFEHVADGYVYRFQRAGSHDVGSTPDLFLFDADKDGDIDTHASIDAQEWSSRGYSQGNLWISYPGSLP